MCVLVLPSLARPRPPACLFPPPTPKPADQRRPCRQPGRPARTESLLLPLLCAVRQHLVRLTHPQSRHRPSRSSRADTLLPHSYANSVLQSLYFSKPFRQLVESYHPYGTDPPSPPPPLTTLLTTLRDLFSTISRQPKSIGTVAPQAFINQLKRDNEFFRSTLHQDAHEFLNFLINSVAEALERDEKKRMVGTGFGAHAKTWVHSLFEGILTNETRCLTCETVTSRDEAFLDLSIDIEQNSSVTACLRQFSASEMLCQRNKFSCDKCCGLQEAEKRMKIKKLPNILALHLKRFKYEESLQRHVKLTYRVVFPFELRLFNTADDVSDPDRLYELWAIVVHIGVGPHHGHYITIVKSGKRWIVFDDNNVYPIEQHDISRFFGDTPGSGSGYVLFYQAVDFDWAGVDLPVPQTPSVAGTTTTNRERAQT
ncbi:uncharacterized protein RHOBADRAFT_35025, partial [Rhodotorula graminis WP1]